MSPSTMSYTTCFLASNSRISVTSTPHSIADTTSTSFSMPELLHKASRNPLTPSLKIPPPMSHFPVSSTRPLGQSLPSNQSSSSYNRSDELGCAFDGGNKGMKGKV